MAPPLACAAVSGLDLVGDDEAAARPDPGGGLLHEARRDVGQALIGQDGADDQGRDPVAGGLQGVHGPVEPGEVGLGQGFTRQAGLRRPEGLGEGEAAETGRTVRPRRQAAHGAHQLGVAVVGGVRAEDTPPTRGHAGHAKGDLVGLGPRAGEDDALDPLAQLAGEALGQADDVLMQIAGVDVQGRLLPSDGLGHPGVAVPHAGHVVVHVDISPALGVEEPGPLSPDDVQGRLIEQGRPGAEGPVAPLQQPVRQPRGPRWRWTRPGRRTAGSRDRPRHTGPTRRCHPGRACRPPG